jgi:hypothetical protein
MGNVGLRQCRSATQIVVVVRVAAIDDGVASLQQWLQLVAQAVVDIRRSPVVVRATSAADLRPNRQAAKPPTHRMHCAAAATARLCGAKHRPGAARLCCAALMWWVGTHAGDLKRRCVRQRTERLTPEA